MSVRIFTAPCVLLAIVGAALAADPGDAAAGKAFFSQTCMQCHTADPNEGGGEIGPSLVGLIGRTAEWATAGSFTVRRSRIRNSSGIGNLWITS